MRKDVFEKDAVNECAKQNREQAYKKEADPLYMEVQRGELDKQVWLDKVQEIKDRFPYVDSDVVIEAPEGTTEDLTEAETAKELEKMAGLLG